VLAGTPFCYLEYEGGSSRGMEKSRRLLEVSSVGERYYELVIASSAYKSCNERLVSRSLAKTTMRRMECRPTKVIGEWVWCGQ
jgi:hypothetical protein